MKKLTKCTRSALAGALAAVLALALALVVSPALAEEDAAGVVPEVLASLRFEGSDAWSEPAATEPSSADGATGQGATLTGVALTLSGVEAADGSSLVEYRVQDADGVWSGWAADGGLSTPGSGAVTAVEARLGSGVGGSVWYRTHLAGGSWGAWAQGPAVGTELTAENENDWRAGADAAAGAVDGLQVVYVPEGGAAPASQEGVASYVEAPAVETPATVEPPESTGATPTAAEPTAAVEDADGADKVESAEPADAATASADAADGANATTSGTKANVSASVTYRVHVQTYGTLDWVTNGSMAGTTGRSKRAEALWVKLDLQGVSGGIEYRVHCQTYGWRNWVRDGAFAGTTGESKRIEAVQIRLTGEVKDSYDVYYRVHGQSYGWQNWVKNGAVAGTTGRSKRVEAVEIVLVKKGGAAPLNSSSASFAYATPRVEYRVHGQSYGWQGWVSNAVGSSGLVLSGSTNQSKRVEAVQLRLTGVDGGITYRVHGQSYGWQGWRSDGATAGTTGSSKRVEAIQVKLTGNAESRYDVWYRVYVQSYGWLGWAKNGETAGTTGLSKRVEALEVAVLPKDSAAPGPTSTPYLCAELMRAELLSNNEGTTVTARTLVDIASKEIGTTGGSKYWAGMGYSSKRYSESWCCIFVDWVLQQAGMGIGGPDNCGTVRPNGIQAALLDAGATKIDVSQAKIGDILVFNWGRKGYYDHVGFVSGVNATGYNTVEGNVYNAVGAYTRDLKWVVCAYTFR